MKRIIYILLLFCLCTSTACHKEDDNDHYCIRFHNLADNSIYVSRKGLYNRQDTIAIYSFYFPLEYLKINPNEINLKSLRATSWEAVFTDKRFCPIDTLMIFVFDAEKVEVGKNAKESVIARYDVSLEDLQRNHWLLSFPPNENMVTIKMWPPYSSYE